MNIDRDKLVSVYYKTRAIIKPSDFYNFPKEIRSSKMFVIDILETLAERKPAHYEFLGIYDNASKRVREDEEVVAIFYTLARKYNILERNSLNLYELDQYNKFHLKKFKADKFLDNKEKAVKLITKDLSNLTNIDSSYISDRAFWLSVIEYAPLDMIEDISYVMPPEFISEREFILDVASMRGEALNGLLGITNYCDDKEIILTALPNCKEMYENASADLQSDIDVLKLFVSLNPKNVEKITPSIIADEKIIEELIDVSSGKVLDYINNYNLTNKNIFTKAINFDCDYLQYMDDTLADDKEFMKTLLAIDKEALEYASERVKADREIVLTYSDDDFDLSIDTFTEEEYKADPELYRKYLSTGNVDNIPAFAYSTKDLMLSILECDFYRTTKYIPSKLLDDEEFQQGMLKIIVADIKAEIKENEEWEAKRNAKTVSPIVIEKFKTFSEAFDKYGETPDLILSFRPDEEIELSKEEIKTLKNIINSTPEIIADLSGVISNSEELYYEALETNPYTFALIFASTSHYKNGQYMSRDKLVEKIFKKYKINEDTLMNWTKTPTIIKVESIFN